MRKCALFLTALSLLSRHLPSLSLRPSAQLLSQQLKKESKTVVLVSVGEQDSGAANNHGENSLKKAEKKRGKGATIWGGDQVAQKAETFIIDEILNKKTEKAK